MKKGLVICLLLIIIPYLTRKVCELRSPSRNKKQAVVCKSVLKRMREEN